jgi:hypothetical protein
MKTRKGQQITLLTLVNFYGRGGGIRTHDPLHPMQVRYLAALRPDEDLDYNTFFIRFARAVFFSNLLVQASRSRIDSRASRKA